MSLTKLGQHNLMLAAHAADLKLSAADKGHGSVHVTSTRRREFHDQNTKQMGVL